MIRVVIVDDQAVIRAGVARILSPADGFEIVAECSDGDEVPDAVALHRPDVVLMDLACAAPTASPHYANCVVNPTARRC